MENKDEYIDNLVICSTLNQITNYLIIEALNPQRIFNITFSEDSISKLNSNINPNKWDIYLREECKEYKFIDIELSIKDIQKFKEIKKILQKNIIDKTEGAIYWHITGGQRTIALAINELIKDRDKPRNDDRLMYIEGNTKKLIILNNKNNEVREQLDICYKRKDLTFQTALKLVGFKAEKIENNFQLKNNDDKKIEFEEEHNFYQKLYKSFLNKEMKKIKFEYNDKICENTFRNLLLYSNKMPNDERKQYVKDLFENLRNTNVDFKNEKYDILNSREIEGNYPAGYIFEKIVAHKIFDLIKDRDDVSDMATSLKTYFDNTNDNYVFKKGKTIDEIDIVLLTDTGNIINFECKSGGMNGDNAKSTKYTTYRLSGVFGMPILISPLYTSEISNKQSIDEVTKETLEKQIQAVSSAKSAELEVISIDELDNKSDNKIYRLLI